MPVRPTSCPGAVFRAGPKRDAAVAWSLGGAPPSCRRPCSPQNPPWPHQVRPRTGPWSTRGRRGGACLPGSPGGERPGSLHSAVGVRLRAARRASTSRIRRTARRGPCDDEPPRWPGRHGSACGGGNRGSARVGGCSAGRCAYPCSLLLLCLGRRATDFRPSTGMSCGRTAVSGVSYQRVASSRRATTYVGTRNAPVAYGRPYEGTHPGREPCRHPLRHARRPVRDLAGPTPGHRMATRRTP